MMTKTRRTTLPSGVAKMMKRLPHDAVDLLKTQVEQMKRMLSDDVS